MTKEDTATRTLALPSGYAVDVHSSPENLVLRAPDGRICMRIRLTEAGPEVEVEAAKLSVTSAGAIALRGEQLILEGRQGIALHSGQDLSLYADGKLHTKAFEQHMEAATGDFWIEANDDVRVDAERIRLNAPEAAPLRRLSPDGSPSDAAAATLAAAPATEGEP